MKRLAEWHATQEGRIRFQSVVDVAAQLAGVYVTAGAIRTLLSREDWLTYREEIAVDEMLAIRRRFESRMQDYIDAHYEALQGLRGAGAWKDVAQVAEPVLDRIYPKREERGPHNATVIVNLGPGASTPAHLTDYVDAEIVVEEVSRKQLPPPT